MKRTTTLIYVFAGLLVAGGILMRIFDLFDEQISLTVPLFGILIYILATPERPRIYRRNASQENF